MAHESGMVSALKGRRGALAAIVIAAGVMLAGIAFIASTATEAARQCANGPQSAGTCFRSLNGG